MEFFKLGCNWGQGKPDFYKMLLKHSIVICAEYNMKKGDFVAITQGHNVVALAQIINDKIPSTEYPILEKDFENLQIDYEDWNYVAKSVIWEIPQKYRFKYKLQQGICQIQNEDIRKTISSLIKRIMNEKMINDCVNLLKGNHNLILTGAPGTGKTYLAKQIAESVGAKWKLVQFHPSYDYTDFVEGLRPIEKDGTLGFERKDGVFKEFCKDTISLHKVFKDTYDEIASYINNGGEELNTESKKFVVTPDGFIRVRSKDNRSTDDEKKTIPINTLWQEYSYIACHLEEFSNEDSITKDRCNRISEKIGLGIKDVGSYVVKLLKEMVKRSKHKIADASIGSTYVFIIDEINRGEISKIFGELFFSIDPGYRGEKGKVSTQYQNLVKEDDLFYDGFYVPENVYIIGTMNDIDRSVESMDFAMRRRFAWKEISAESRQSMLDEEEAWAPLAKPASNIIDEIKNRMNNLNACIIDQYLSDGLSTKDKVGLTKAYQIGASYFLKYGLYNNFEELWVNHLEGLLFEYLRGTTNIETKIERLKAAYNDSEAH